MVNRHLDGLKHLPVDTRSNLISRLAFSRGISGSIMDFIVPISPARHSGLPANKNGNGAKWAAVFPQVDRNPYMPLTAGAPGILFSMHMELQDRPEWVLFRPRERKLQVKDEEGRMHEKKVAVWEYLGDYRFTHVGSLSAAEFREQRPKVKQWWSQKIWKTKKWLHYVAIRARVYLRKQGRAITDAAVEEIKSGLVSTAGVTVEDIVGALERGDEAIEVWALECVRYGHEFNKSLVGLSNAVPPQRLAKKQKEKKAKASSRKSTSIDSVKEEQDAGASAPRRSKRAPKPRALDPDLHNFPAESEGEEDDDTWEPAVERSPEL